MRSQRLAILEYARKYDFRIDDFIAATASGQASEKCRRLDELMNVLHRGDRWVVSELSRIGRSLGQIVAILDALAKAGVARCSWDSFRRHLSAALHPLLLFLLLTPSFLANHALSSPLFF